MAVTYGFYNSLNKDRVYNAEQMSSIFNGIITDGVFASIGGSLMPIAGTGMQVVVKTGKCWFNSTWTLNDALFPLDISVADVSLTRIDAIVVEINSAISTRANTIKVIKGTPSANPAKPVLANTETLHQYALGYVTVGAGVTSITADKIEVNVGKTTCPFITSVLQQTDITALFNQWDAEFNAWFENVQSQLSGDIAANLQRQIDARVKIADKATSADIVTGISDEKWVTPKALHDGEVGYRIGDILATARTDLDNKWLLCDGRIIDKNAYPKLFEILKRNWMLGKRLEYDINVHTPYITHFCEYNGEWVGIGILHPIDTNIKNIDVQTWHGTSPAGVLKAAKNIMPTDNGLLSFDCHGFKVLNGKLVAYGSIGFSYPSDSSDASRGRIWYTENLKTWKYKDLLHQNYAEINDLIYTNGIYVATCGYGTGSTHPKLLKSQLLDGNWSEIALPDNVYRLMNICCGNTFVIPCYTGQYNRTLKESIIVSASIDGPWKNIQLSGGFYSFVPKSALYKDGMYFISGTGKMAESDANYRPIILMATNPESSWTAYPINSAVDLAKKQVNSFQYVNGKYYIICGNYLLSTTNPIGEWQAEEIYTDREAPFSPKNLYISDTAFAAAGAPRSDDSDYTAGYVYKGSFLPVSSSDICNNYIRAK